ncbi:MAG: SDR family NAD(P)-dependent oxidoreductase, partial [Tolumonas sp.]
YGQPGAIEDLPTQALRAQFNTNLFGWHHLIRQVLPVMLKNNRGRIIQVSSLLGLVAMKYRGAYNASKFALEGYTDTLRLELRDTAVQVSLVEPGPVRSQFRSNALKKFLQHIDVNRSRHQDIYQLTLQRLQNPEPKNPFTLEPESCVAPVLHALRSHRARVRYGVTFPTHLFAVLRRLLPVRWLDSILCRSA